jgi:hypothetical protein
VARLRQSDGAVIVPGAAGLNAHRTGAGHYLFQTLEFRRLRWVIEKLDLTARNERPQRVHALRLVSERRSLDELDALSIKSLSNWFGAISVARDPRDSKPAEDRNDFIDDRRHVDGLGARSAPATSGELDYSAIVRPSHHRKREIIATERRI